MSRAFRRSNPITLVLAAILCVGFFVFFFAFFWSPSAPGPDWYLLSYSFMERPPAGADADEGGGLAAMAGWPPDPQSPKAKD